MINPEHLRLHVIRPTLEYLNPAIPYSLAAENLLMGTCAQESAMGEYLVQLGGGPALGIFQMEPATYDDIWTHYLNYHNDLGNEVSRLESGFYSDDSLELSGNLYYATAMCRVHYWRRPEPLPVHDDIEGMAHYWKKFYNTVKGKGTTKKFIDKYARYVKEND